MTKNIAIDVGISLNDAELISYQYLKNTNNILVNIKTWNDKTLVFSFKDPLLFMDKGCDIIKNLCQDTSNSDLYNAILLRAYEKIPENCPYKRYQLIDLDDFPALEIICEKFEVISLSSTN